MQILASLFAAKLDVQETLDAEADLGPARLIEITIITDDRIRLQPLSILLNKAWKMRTANLLLALNDELEIERNVTGRFEEALSGFDVMKDVTLFLLSAAPREMIFLPVSLASKGPETHFSRGSGG